MFPYEIPPRTKRCEWLTRTCRIHLIPTLQSRVHTGHCQPSTGRPVHTPTHIHACRTRALLSASHATKQFPIHGFTNCILYARYSYTEQNMPFTHRTEHTIHTHSVRKQKRAFCFTQNKAYCSHTEQGMLFTRKAEHVVRTQNRESCSHTEQCMMFAHNRVCCSHTTECAVRTQNRANCLHTTGRAVHIQQGVLFAHRQSILFTHRTKHIVP